MKRFLILAMIVLIVALACAPVFAARFAYVTAARDNAGNPNEGWSQSGGLAHSGARFNGPQSGWASSGAGPYEGPGISGTGYTYTSAHCYYSMAGYLGRWGQWTFNVPDEADKSGYYDVYYGIRFGATAGQAICPVWTITNAGEDFVNNTFNNTIGSNVWNKIATNLQFNRGESYTVRCAFPLPDDVVSGQRINFDMVAFVFVKSNAPSGLTAVKSGDGTSIDLSWTAPDPAPVSYIVQRKAGLAGTWADIAGGDSGVAGPTTTSFTDVLPMCGVTWYYRVKAVDANGIVSGACDEAFCLRCAPEPPAKATNPSPAMDADGVHTDLSDAAVVGKLSWTPDEGAESHDVYFGTAPDALVFKANVTGSSFDPGELLANTDYYWRIDSKNEAGSTTGDVWHFKTGISLTISPIRATNRGEITGFATDFDPEMIARDWNVTTWHKANDNVYIDTRCNDGFTWAGWSLNADGSDAFDGNGLDPDYWRQQWAPYVMPDQTSNVTLYAVYTAPQHSLTVNCIPAGAGTVTATDLDWPSAPLTAFEPGDRAHLVAAPAAGWVFAGYVSDKAGTFDDAFAGTTNYAMTEEDTVITAYFAKAMANIVNSGTRGISSNDLAGTVQDWWTSQVNVNSYSPTNNQLYSRALVKFPMTIPAISLREGLCRLAAGHSFASNYSSAVTTMVSAYPITKPWVYSTTAAGAWWTTTDNDPAVPGATLWNTPGGDFDTENELGTAQAFEGNPNVDITKSYVLDKSVDYATLLANGVLFMGDHEGDITYRKGFTKTAALNFFYNPPTGENSGVITTWALLGAYSQGASGDHQARIDTDQVAGTYNGIPVAEMYLAPKIGASYNGATWKEASSATDIIDLLDPAWLGPVGENKVAYASVYVKNPGESLQYYIGLGSDDHSRTWLDTAQRAYKSTASGVGYDQVFQGPFTMTPGWHRLLVKIENGTAGYGFYLRLANADRTALTGVETFTFATSDSTAPTNPTVATEAGGAVSGVATSNATPSFALAGPTDPEVPGEGVSGLKGFKIYFGTDPEGVPTEFQTSWTFAPEALTAYGTYYLRVATVDQALNESAPATLFTYVYGETGPVYTPVAGIKDLWALEDGYYELTGKTVTGCVDGAFWIEETNRSAALKCIGTATQGKKYTVKGHLETLNGQRVLNNAVVENEADGDEINPVIMLVKSIGGTSTPEHPSVDGGIGVYNLGLLVKVAGTVTGSGAGYFWLNDGGWASVKVISSTIPSGNVTVTGLLGVENVDGAMVPTLTVRSPGDIK